MRCNLLWLCLLVAPCLATGQSCTAYAVIDVFDSKSHMGIDGLEANDFEVKMGGSSLPIVSMSQSFNNRVLVMVQGAGSLKGPLPAEITRGIAGFVRLAPAGRPVAFAAFANRTAFTKGFSANVQERSAWIDDVIAQLNSIGNDPAVFDALHEGIAFFGPDQPGDTIILISTGHDVSSKRNEMDLEKEFTQHHTRLLLTAMTTGVIEGFNANHQNKYEEVHALHRLASSTGGSYTRLVSPNFMDFAWAGYLVGVGLPPTLDKARDWKLQLRGAAAKAHKDALIYQPYSVAPCSRPIAETK